MNVRNSSAWDKKYKIRPRAGSFDGRPLPSCLGRHRRHSRDVYQAFPLHFCMLRAIKNWTVGGLVTRLRQQLNRCQPLPTHMGDFANSWICFTRKACLYIGLLTIRRKLAAALEKLNQQFTFMRDTYLYVCFQLYETASGHIYTDIRETDGGSSCWGVGAETVKCITASKKMMQVMSACATA